MPIFRTKNEDFFKIWSPDMAYVLGFSPRMGVCIEPIVKHASLNFKLRTQIYLKEIQTSLGSDHKITVRKRAAKWKPIYRLQIGSKIIFEIWDIWDLLKIKARQSDCRKCQINIFQIFCGVILTVMETLFLVI